MEGINVTVFRDTDNNITDIQISQKTRNLFMLGSSGAMRELTFLKAALTEMPDGSLPVLIGSGTGYALDTLYEYLLLKYPDGHPLLVIDKEKPIIEQTGLKEKYSSSQKVHWLTDTTLNKTLNRITAWQALNGNLPLYPIINPFYLRFHKTFYSPIYKACEASQKSDLWGKMAYPRFSAKYPRILLLTSKYFLIGEFIAACERMEVPYHLVQVPQDGMGTGEFVEQILQAIISFKPDFALTINHLGVDREGVLVELLEKLRLPLASWFVDNPHLILSLYSRLVSPWTTLFTWDADNLPTLTALGFEHVLYLPLGTDAVRFAPGVQKPQKEWMADISFVGNSMVSKVLSRMEKTPLPHELTHDLKAMGSAFSASDERTVATFLQKEYPYHFSIYNALDSIEGRLGFEAMLTWEATRQYRLACIQATFDYNPLIVGDIGWKKLIPPQIIWRYLPEVNYYHDLPGFYPCSSINYNCTSKQMKGAVNQRVFDVPATNAFLLTDYREQIEHLFEPEKEVICYHSPEEAKELIKHFLASPNERKLIAAAARKRILSCHTYEHRIRTIAKSMRSIYG